MMDQADTRTKFKVRYIHENPGYWSGNIMFPERAQAMGGKFPANHPCAAGSLVFGGVGDCQAGDGPDLRKFRDMGYWASCFPEGDGITMKTKNDQTAQQVMADIREVFGWDVVPG